MPFFVSPSSGSQVWAPNVVGSLCLFCCGDTGKEGCFPTHSGWPHVHRDAATLEPRCIHSAGGRTGRWQLEEPESESEMLIFQQTGDKKKGN